MARSSEFAQEKVDEIEPLLQESDTTRMARRSTLNRLLPRLLRHKFFQMGTDDEKRS
jgi:hypothetical protein